MSNETKVGILAVIAIAIAIWGYTFLKGRNLLTTSNLLYVEYQSVDMLATSAPVVINGFQVGVVASMNLKPEDMQTIVVVLDISSGVNVPKTAIAEIVSLDITGGKGVNLNFSQPCQGGDCAESGDYLQGRTLGILSSLVPKDELDVYLGKLGSATAEVFDTLNGRLADPEGKGIARAFRDLQGTLANLNATTSRLNGLLASTSGDIDNSLANFSKISDTIVASSSDIRQILANAASLSDQLSEVKLGETVDNANAAISTTNETLEQLKSTLSKADVAMTEVTGLIADAKAGKGTLGQLITNDSLYYRLSSASEQLESFLEDLETRPYRYVPLKSRRKIRRYDRKDGD